MPENAQQALDWPPQATAMGRPDGERRHGSTGQLFEAKNGQWCRVQTARVACRVPNGIMIRLAKPGYDDGTGDGVKMPGHDGPGVRLNGPSSLHVGAGNTEGAGIDPGFTEVDAEWWGKWLEQHALDPLVTMEQVYEEKPKDDRPTEE